MVDVPLHASLLRPSDWLGSIEERLDRLGGRRVAGGWHLTNLLRARTTLAEVGPSGGPRLQERPGTRTNMKVTQS